jgi:CBS domain-containing protein
MPHQTTAAQIMRRDVVTFTPETSVMEAIAVLLKHKISGAPVLGPEGRVVGILSEVDCTNHLVDAVTHNEPTGFVLAAC